MNQACAPVAIVTGAAAGMGHCHAMGLAAAGFSVVGIDLAAFDGADQLVPVLADVCDESAIEAAFEGVLARFGRIDVLVNNAGGALDGAALADTSLDAWERTLRLNLTSQFLCIRACLPAMRRQGGGRIVNIASAAAFSGITAALHREDGANLVGYVAAKGGVIAMTRALARELGPLGIAVNAVAPGFTPTRRVRASFPEAAVARMVSDQAFRRAQDAGDATGAVVFLASAAAGFITGQVIRVDGGGSMG